jgi:nitrite reductase (NADH) large subunit
MAWHDFEVETVTVRCEPSGREATIVRDTTLLDAVHQLLLPLGQSCDGVALCGFCRVTVVDGLANLTPASSEELKLLCSLHAGADERLACCARVKGPVTITTDYW